MDKKGIELVKEFKKKLGKKISFQKFILFGSRSRSDFKDNSDFDILLISEEFRGKKSFKRSPKIYLEWDYPYQVDIICLTPEEYSNKKNKIGIVREASKEGIEL